MVFLSRPAPQPISCLIFNVSYGTEIYQVTEQEQSEHCLWQVLRHRRVRRHFFELGQKIRLDGIGIFKVGFSSIGVTKLEDCSAATITERRILFQPETERVVVGQTTNKEGKIVQKYVVAKSLIKDVLFEETHENAMKNPSAGSGTVDDPSAGSGTVDDPSTGSGSSAGSETGGSGNNSGGSGIIPTPTDPEDDQPGD